MPARKPSVLIKWNREKNERLAREAADASMLPKTQLSKKPPSALKGNAYASAMWTRLIELYSGVDGTIITAFDEDLLVVFCKVESELSEILSLRDETKKAWEKHTKLLGKINPKPDQLKDYYAALGAASALLQRWQGLDARLDGKRKLLYSLAQSLYLTPRSRAGAPPPEKPPEEPESEMGKLLDGMG